MQVLHTCPDNSHARMGSRIYFNSIPCGFYIHWSMKTNGISTVLFLSRSNQGVLYYITIFFPRAFAFVLIIHLHKKFVRLIGHRLLPLFYSWETQLREAMTDLTEGQVVSTLGLKCKFDGSLFIFCLLDLASSGVMKQLPSALLTTASPLAHSQGHHTPKPQSGKKVLENGGCLSPLGFSLFFYIYLFDCTRS